MEVGIKFHVKINRIRTISTCYTTTHNYNSPLLAHIDRFADLILRPTLSEIREEDNR